METKYFGEFRDVYSKASDDVYSKALTDTYSKAVREMYSQFKKKEAHPMEKYIGRFVSYCGKRLEVVGYSYNELTGEPRLIIDASRIGGWSTLPSGVIFKECEYYWYSTISDLID